MTTYYISASGSDANNGLGPDASHASNKPYATLGKAMNTGSPVLPGDTVYLGPGIMYQGAAGIIPIAAISSVGSPTAFRGDPSNAQGFKDGSGVRLAPAPCWVTMRTSADTTDGPVTSGTTLFVFTTNSCKGLQFYDSCFEASPTAGVLVAFSLATNSDILFQDCRLFALSVLNVTTNVAAAAARNLTVRRCFSVCNQFFAISSTTAAATADADLAITIENNLIFGKLTANIGLSASGGNLAGGVHFNGNTVVFPVSGSAHVQTTALRVSTVTPITIEGNVFIGGIPVTAGTAGHVIDNGYNRFYQQGASSNFTAAGTTLTGFLPQLVLPDLVKWGLDMPRNDIFGWTDLAHANQRASAWTNVTPDFRGRTARPWGAGASIGCWQAQGVAQDATSAITGGGANSLKLTGAGEVSMWIPVDAAGFTVSILTKSTSYGGTNYPQMIVVANPNIGVTSDTTVTASSASEQTITTATITPTAKGVMEVRLISRSSSVSSSTFFDLLTSP